MPLESKLTPHRSLYAIRVLLFAAGVLSGSLALSDAEASVPPLNWEAIAIIAFGSAAGISLVLGIQISFKNWRAAKVAWHFFFCGCFYFLGCGVCALVLSVFRNTFGPPAMLSISIAIGLLTGLGLCRSIAAR